MAWYLLPREVIDYLVPNPSPLRDPHLAVYYAVSILILHTTFHVLSNTVYSGADPKKLKQRCWILTTVNGGIMTLVSIPYLIDLLGSGFDFHAIKPRTAWLAHPMSCFFVAYLTSDLGLGSIYYRKLINLSSGWIHHTAYTFLFAFWLHKGWSHIAVMACIFELPTFTMGIASLHPPFRSNMLFTSTFFLTRVFFHFGLLVAACTTHGRSTPGIDGSWGPAISIIVTYPMHLWWGYKCVMSIRRRMYKRKQEARKQREAILSNLSNGDQGSASYFANSAAQLFNGFPDPNIASALNTPATTPGSSPLLMAADKKPASLQYAFQRAAAFAEEPMKLVLGRSRRSSDSSDVSLSESKPVTALTPATDRQFFSNAVRPLGAGPDDREPFLAIRSPAEARDRARRLVADAIRKAWASAPESWRQQFEAEMEANNINTRPLTRRSSGGESSNTSGEETDFDGVNAVEKTRTQRGKDAARRAFFRAIHRAINGKEGQTSQVELTDEGADAGQVNPEEAKETAKNERRLLQTILKFSGIQLPPDLIGQEYIVREFPVERGEDGRGKRIVGQIRRRMEINRRDVVVFD